MNANAINPFNRYQAGTHPIEILQRKFTLHYFFKHFDWVL